MNVKRLLKVALFYLTVPICVGCGEKLKLSEDTLCAKCQERYNEVKSLKCSYCLNTYDRCVCVNEKLRNNKISKLVKCFRYASFEDNEPSNNLIYSLKRENRKDTLNFLSNELADSIISSFKDYKDYEITNVPRRKRSVNKYGYDHSKELAKSVSKLLSIEYVDTLKSLSRRDQKRLSHSEREENPSFALKRRIDVNGKKIILVDDVVTTGASMICASRLLYNNGVKNIIGATLAIAFKDPYRPIKNLDYVTF